MLALVDGDTPDVSALPPLIPEVEPEPAPIELVLPGVAVLSEDGVVVLEELDEVAGVGAVSTRLLQAPRDTAATSAKAAHEVMDALIFETP